MILDSPNHFGQVPIVLVGSNLFWSDPNHFGQVQIIKISPKKSNLKLTKAVRGQKHPSEAKNIMKELIQELKRKD